MSSPSSTAHPRGLHNAAPIPALGVSYTLLASSGSSGIGSGSLNQNPLPRWDTGTYLRTEVMECLGWDTVSLEINYDASSSTTTGYPIIVPFGCNIGTQSTAVTTSPPNLTNDYWFMLPATDGSITATALSGTVTVGSGSVGPLVAFQKVYGQVIQAEAAVANSNKIRQMVSLKVRGVRWLTFAIAEKGDTANPGKITLKLAGII